MVMGKMKAEAGQQEQEQKGVQASVECLWSCWLVLADMLYSPVMLHSGSSQH